MEQRSCLIAIESQKASLSAKEQLVAEFILADPGSAVHPSLEELADRIGVSDSTLFRFVRKIGYDGYQQFRIALATETVEPRQTVYETTDEVEDAESAIEMVFRANMKALELTKGMLNRADMERSAELLSSAGRVQIFGVGGSGIVAHDLYHKLLRTGVPCVAPGDFHLQLMQASQAQENEVAVVVSHSGSNKDTLMITDILKGTGCSIIAITSHARSPLGKLADITLRSEGSASPYVSEAFSARISQLSITDTLYVEVMKNLGDAGIAGLEKMRAAIAKRRI